MHKCKNPKIYMLQDMEELACDSGDEEGRGLKEGKNNPDLQKEESGPEISIHAMTRTPNSNTMRLLGQIKEET